MKITKITKRVGRKIGLPQSFSSVTFETEVSADVDTNESPEEVDKAVWELAEKCLSRDIERWREKVKRGSTQSKEKTETQK